VQVAHQRIGSDASGVNKSSHTQFAGSLQLREKLAIAKRQLELPNDFALQVPLGKRDLPMRLCSH
jgi:hypothetical protein